MRSIIVRYIMGVLFSIEVVTPRQTAENTCSFGKGEGARTLRCSLAIVLFAQKLPAAEEYPT